MFVRIKKIKGKDYAYLVSNSWKKRKKGSRQKVTKYLGKIKKLERINNKSLQEFLKIENFEDYLKFNTKKITLDLIRLELHNHNFKETKRDIWLLDDSLVDLRNKKVTIKESKKQICLELNNNFLCSYTLRKLIDFKLNSGLTKLQIGKQLANYFEAAGILVPKELFVEIAKKILVKVEKV